MPKLTKTKPHQVPENLSIQAMEMLTQGRGLAFQLRDLLLDDQIPVSGAKLALAEDLLDKIDGSFTHSISALESDEMKSEVSGESSKSTTSRKTAAAPSRKRREKGEGDESWSEISSSLVHDGHAWRKYGQKHILNAKHSRNYYKCTHKEHLGCPAKKHVQQIGDDPLSYRTVYYFKHTCTMTPMNTTLNDRPAVSAQMILESAVNPNSSIMFNFESSQKQPESDHNNNAFCLSLMKQEEGFIRNDHTTEHFTSTSNLGSYPAMGVDDEFMNCSTDYSPSIFYPEDAEDLWSYI
ncbi:unnamed protein product [Rhodiola kirilowii]